MSSLRNYITPFLSAVLLVVSLTGCAIGPLVSHETARTVGKSNHELVGGYGMAGYVFKWNYGVTQNFDLGLHLESLSTGIRAKYAFLNQSAGWSLAGALGIGSSIGGSHYYGDLAASYLVGQFEPYGTLRLVHVRNDPQEYGSKDTGQVTFHVDAIEYDYGQLMLGSRFWFNPHWLLSIEVSTLFTVSSGVHVGDGLLLGAAFGYRF